MITHTYRVRDKHTWSVQADAIKWAAGISDRVAIVTL